MPSSCLYSACSSTAFASLYALPLLSTASLYVISICVNLGNNSFFTYFYTNIPFLLQIVNVNIGIFYVFTDIYTNSQDFIFLWCFSMFRSFSFLKERLLQLPSQLTFIRISPDRFIYLHGIEFFFAWRHIPFTESWPLNSIGRLVCTDRGLQ